jgi:hypothetical protein
MINKKTYGKNIDNPVLLNSVETSLAYLENLVTQKKGYHIIFHRIGSQSTNDKPVDVYQVMTSDNKYDNIYISIYSETNHLIPPKGYLFENDEIDGEIINEEHVFAENLDNLDSISEYAIALPLLERHMNCSYGVNGKLDNFPYELIKILYENGELDFVSDINKLLDSIKKQN